jgi:hypothetical protein
MIERPMVDKMVRDVEIKKEEVKKKRDKNTYTPDKDTGKGE